MCIAAAIAGSTIVGSVIASDAQEDAANAAAGAQRDANAATIAEQRAAREELRKLLQPYVDAGPAALKQQQSILGLNGAQAQQAVIDQIKAGPQFKELVRAGEQSILSNASATGGLRGGNVQAALGQFSPSVLNSLINQQFQNLSGITTLGQNSAAGVGNAGMQTAGAIGSALQSSGAAQAGAYMAQGQAQANIGNQISGLGGFIGGMFQPSAALTTTPQIQQFPSAAPNSFGFNAGDFSMGNYSLL
jgi:hypothetical protein